MKDMTPDRFDEFFQSLYGYEPFPWQAKLARQVAGAQPGDSSWPQALTLPTAAGKSACLDIAIFALACQADRCPEEGSRRIRKYTASANTLTSEDDSYSATVRVPLDDHLEGVERWARRIGEGVGLTDSLASDLALAACWHDAGKADPRFQLWMHGGNPWAVGLPLLAKSDKTRTHSSGCRHELLSVRMIKNSGLLESALDDDLVLHLVGSHHGHCRPFAPVVDSSNPVQVEETILGCQMSARTDTKLEQLDSGVPERFWALVRRYGWWGLSYLEALMRLADHRCSEAEGMVEEVSQ